MNEKTRLYLLGIEAVLIAAQKAKADLQEFGYDKAATVRFYRKMSSLTQGFKSLASERE